MSAISGVSTAVTAPYSTTQPKAPQPPVKTAPNPTPTSSDSDGDGDNDGNNGIDLSA